MRRIRNHKFNDKNYRIKWKPSERYTKEQIKELGILGSCDAPSNPHRSIFIDPKLEGKDLLKVLVDESIHATNWKISNGVVDKMSDDIAAFLWSIGLRFS